MSAVPNEFLRETEIVGALEGICQELELSATQHNAAKDHYEAVGKWLSEANDPMLRTLIIYAHGSVALGTTVKPHGRGEHDVDLVSHAPDVRSISSPAAIKKTIGSRLREHAYYASILEEKRRCWRLNYANEFHLDITPSIPNPECSNGGELVPDKELRRWKATNPRGYKSLFDRRARLQPKVRLAKSLFERRADVEPFPAQTILKGVLRRTVQLTKRHRDIYFERVGPNLAPISIIITTLLARAYEHCVVNTYDTELQLIVDVIRTMPNFIEGPTVSGHSRWAVWNETTQGENFAEKWNSQPALPRAFFSWHAQLLIDIEQINAVYGLDQLTKSLSESFGPRPVIKAMAALTESVNVARNSGRLVVVPRVGLSIALGSGTTVRANTFFGAE